MDNPFKNSITDSGKKSIGFIDPGRFYKLSEVASICGCSRTTAWRWVQRGELFARRNGKTALRVPGEEILRRFSTPVIPEKSFSELEAEARRLSRGKS